MFRKINRKIAALALTIGLLGAGAGAASAAALVPSSNGQLTGTVYVCVNATHENQQYVELGHPAPGNCAAGYLQYTANQAAPAATASPSPPAVLVNSETFKTGLTPLTGDAFTVNIPAGSHVVAGSVTATDLDATAASPDVVTVKSVDTVTGQVTVTYSAGTIGHSIQLSYEYSR